MTLRSRKKPLTTAQNLVTTPQSERGRHVFDTGTFDAPHLNAVADEPSTFTSAAGVGIALAVLILLLAVPADADTQATWTPTRSANVSTSNPKPLSSLKRMTNAQWGASSKSQKLKIATKELRAVSDPQLKSTPKSTLATKQLVLQALHTEQACEEPTLAADTRISPTTTQGQELPLQSVLKTRDRQVPSHSATFIAVADRPRKRSVGKIPIADRDTI